MKHRVALLFVVLALLMSFSTLQAQESQPLTVFAAASLTDAFEQIATDFESLNPGADVIFNFGGSSALATQLVNGAPADVFASANARQMQVVQDGGRIASEPRTFARNLLVLVTPADNPANITTLRDLSNPGVKLVLAAPDVPVRTYTDLLLARLASLPTYGEAYRAAVLSNLVSEEDNVRQVLLKVALGEADAGIVYQTDVTPDSAGQVFTIPIPRAVNSLARYPIAATTESANPELAQAFVDYVLSEAGQATLVQWGFVPAG
jgi:molybdate transport system substrate-binding protein